MGLLILIPKSLSTKNKQKKITNPQETPTAEVRNREGGDYRAKVERGAEKIERKGEKGCRGCIKR